MEESDALAALTALGHPGRLAIFRRLVAAGAPGTAAGDLASALGMRASTLSGHLAILARAGFVRGTRDGRSIRYVAEPGGLRRLLAFLLEDCCGGQPELCTALWEEVGHGIDGGHEAGRAVSVHRQFGALDSGRGDPHP